MKGCRFFYLHLADNRPNHYPRQGNRYGGTIAVRHYTEQVREWYNIEWLAYQTGHSRLFVKTGRR
jgi:hypothetical protein